MRMKLIAATLLVAGAVGLTGGTIVLSNADGQTSGRTQGTAAGGGSASSSGQVLGPFTATGPVNGSQPPATNDAFGPGTPGMPAGGIGGQYRVAPGASGMQPGGMNAQGGLPGGAYRYEFNAGSPVVDYKFVDLPTPDRESFVEAIKKAWREGWEFCGSESFQTGRPSSRRSEEILVLVFKKHKGTEVPMMGGFGGAGGGTGRAPGMTVPGGGNLGGGQAQAGGGVAGLSAPAPGISAGTGGSPSAANNNRNARGGMAPGAAVGGAASGRTRGQTEPNESTSPRTATTAASQSALELKVFTLKHANAADLASVLTSVFASGFPNGFRGPGVGTTQDSFQVSGVLRTNQLIVRSTPEILKEVEKLLKELDVPAKSMAPPGARDGS